MKTLPIICDNCSDTQEHLQGDWLKKNQSQLPSSLIYNTYTHQYKAYRQIQKSSYIFSSSDIHIYSFKHFQTSQEIAGKTTK